MGSKTELLPVLRLEWKGKQYAFEAEREVSEVGLIRGVVASVLSVVVEDGTSAAVVCEALLKIIKDIEGQFPDGLPLAG
jgi:hypothetical protein